MRLQPRILEQRHLDLIATLVGRSLTADDLASVASLEVLGPGQLECVRAISGHSTPLAAMYLQEIVPAAALSDAKMFVEAVVKAARGTG